MRGVLKQLERQVENAWNFQVESL